MTVLLFRNSRIQKHRPTVLVELIFAESNIEKDKGEKED